MGQKSWMGRSGSVDPRKRVKVDALLEDLRGMFENLVTGVSYWGWNELDDRYVVSCTGEPSGCHPSSS